MYTFKKGVMKYKDSNGQMQDAGAMMGQIAADAVLSDTSTNPIQNKVVKAAIDELDNKFVKKAELDNIDLSNYETTTNAQTKYDNAVAHSDANLATAKSYSDTNLKSAKTYSDTNFTNMKKYVDSLNDTVSAGITSANEAIEQKTRIEFIIWEEND